MGHDGDTLPAEGPRVDLCDGLAAAGRGDVNTLQKCLDTGKEWPGYAMGAPTEFFFFPCFLVSGG